MDQPDFWIERQLSQSLPEEIARFDRKGFYYKGEFIDDAGEVHRLLKQVLESKLNIATPPPEPPTDKELLRLGNDLMGDCLLCEPDLLLNFARAVLEKCGR